MLTFAQLMPGMEWLPVIGWAIYVGIAAFVIWVAILISRRLPLGQMNQRRQVITRRLIAGSMSGVILLSLVLFFRGPTRAECWAVEKGMTAEMVRSIVGNSLEKTQRPDGSSIWVYYSRDGSWYGWFMVEFNDKGRVERTYSE